MVEERLATIRSRIAEACRRSGRSPDEVTLVGAAKRQPIEKVVAARDAGLRVVGENRVQEAQAKREHLDGLEWHLIGPLQSNKAKKAVELFSVVHSIDRLKIARVLDREAAKRDQPLEGLLEVNLGREPSKHGFDPDAVIGAARELAGLEALRIVGLMAIPPRESDESAARGWFAQLRTLRDELREQPDWTDFPGWLSMGMSGDFEIAIEEGATHVRVGTLLFGERS